MAAHLFAFRRPRRRRVERNSNRLGDSATRPTPTAVKVVLPLIRIGRHDNLRLGTRAYGPGRAPGKEVKVNDVSDHSTGFRRPVRAVPVRKVGNREAAL